MGSIESRAGRALLRWMAGAMVSLAALAGCSRSPAGPEPIRPAEDSCAECRMQILQQKFSAEVLTPEGEHLKFDDLGCFVDHLRKDPALASAPQWASDFETGLWIDARSASYVTTREATPMGSGILAFRGKDAAMARGSPETLGQLLSRRAER